MHPLIIVLLLTATSLTQAAAPDDKSETGVFAFDESVTLPGTPEAIYDMVTGDISGWWDHTFSGAPYRLYIEPKPGGGFFEIFNQRGDGVLHATVTCAERGKRLRFVGPLGLAGSAIDLVSTYTLAAAGPDSTLLRLSVHASGEVTPGLSDAVRKVWRHFLLERLAPYAEAHRKK
jgi:hypothetical protein